MIRSLDIAWIAGIVEGEGCIGIRDTRPTLTVQMTDEDVVGRLHRVSGVGTLVKRPRKTTGGKSVWVWSVLKTDQAAGLIMTLWPLLGERRRQKASEVMSVWRTVPMSKKFRPLCHRGHPLSGSNLGISTNSRGTLHRHCKTCNRERAADRRAKGRATP